MALRIDMLAFFGWFVARYEKKKYLSFIIEYPSHPGFKVGYGV